MEVDIAYLHSPNWVVADMLERFAWLRENDPVHWSEPDGLWVITRYEDVVACSKNQEIFTSGQGVRPGLGAKIGLIDEGEPRHGELRGLINRGFTPRMVKVLEEAFRRITTQAIDNIAAAGECDFVESIAVPLPLRLIATMIGIPEEDYDRFAFWSNSMMAAEGNSHDPEILATATKSYMAYAAYVTEIIDARRVEPREDLVSILVGAKDGGLLTEYNEDQSRFAAHGETMHLANDELIKLLVILMVAGNETTRNGLSGSMSLLIEHPEVRQRLIDNPAMIRDAVEEMLRLVSPVHSFGRTVLEDTELRGKHLRVGDQILMLYGAANRDPEVFEDPERFDIERCPQHVAFGIGGHFCLGANLARMELRVAFEELLRRLPDMEYKDPEGPVLTPSALVRTCSRMNVRFTPEAS